MTARDHDQTTVNYQVTERTLVGVTPTTAVAVLALLALSASFVFLTAGRLVAGLLLLLGALFLAALFMEQALHRRESSVDRAAAGAVDRSRALAGFAVSSTRAWTGASRELTRLRIEQRRLGRERSQLQMQLGAAAYAEQEVEVMALRVRMREFGKRIEQCEANARAVVDRARRRTSKERLAVASTEIREPGDARS